MQIRANGGALNGSELNLNSFEQQFGVTPTSAPLFNQPLPTTSSSLGGNELDYHTVQPPPVRQAEPPSIPTGMVGIPSIEREPINGSDLLFNQPLATDAPVDHTSGTATGVRDSRSADDLLLSFWPRYNGSSNSVTIGYNPPESNSATSGWVGLAGPMGDRSNAGINVVYDDDSTTPNRTILNERSLNDTNGFNSSSLFANSPLGGELGDNSTQPSSTPLPPQPTTGTPIGLEADRTPETRGWLKSLSGYFQSFGRRLNGYDSGFGEGLQGASSDREIPAGADLQGIAALRQNQSLSPRHSEGR